MSYCPKCGKKLTEADSFCSGCGYNIKSDGTSDTPNETSNEIENKEKLMAVVAHLGMAFLNLMSGELGLIVPAIIYYIGKKEMSFSAKHAYNALVWGVVTVTLLGIGEWIYLEMDKSGAFGLGVEKYLIKFVLAGFSVYASYKALRGKEYYYPLMQKLTGAISNIKIAAVICVVLFVVCSMRSAWIIEQRVNETIDNAAANVKEIATDIGKKYDEYNARQPQEKANVSILRICKAIIQRDETSIREFGEEKTRPVADQAYNYMRTNIIQTMRIGSLGVFSDAQLGNLADVIIRKCVENNDIRCRLVSEEDYSAVVEVSYDRYNFSQASMDMMNSLMAKSESNRNADPLEVVYKAMLESLSKMPRAGRDSFLVECTYSPKSKMWGPTDIDSFVVNITKRIMGS